MTQVVRTFSIVVAVVVAAVNYLNSTLNYCNSHEANRINYMVPLPLEIWPVRHWNCPRSLVTLPAQHMITNEGEQGSIRRDDKVFFVDR